LRGSIKRAHPLASIPIAKRFGFRQSLTPKQAERLKIALDWYDRTYKGQDLELRMDVNRKIAAQ